MGSSAKYIAAFFCLVLPGIARAQSVGQVECLVRVTMFIYTAP